MHLTIYYRKGCFKSRFLRASLKVMAWSLRELDAADPEAEAEMVQLKLKNGSGTSAIAPAIYNKEAYSHEMWPILEYLNERNPEGMYPAEIPLRLFDRTLIRRILTDLSPIWPQYVATGDAQPLIDFYDKEFAVFANLVKNRESWRPLEKRPTFVEILFLCLYIEVNYHRPIKNPELLIWVQELVKDHPSLLTFFDEPINGYR
ncbi:hypothetical protein NPS53_08830 [Pseudomonas putida]|uniref:hypothetical protein n=1 Tax=Pseudomonas putida TaxID=303 RepID=UPI0023639B0D|nr:hypothetical protein [Pseudomonas putida]MDD2139678.1 hypothetical protein [Pseudomonas putida]HDS1721602.1 hypothetical protein [Pseudomonas putida]